MKGRRMMGKMPEDVVRDITSHYWLDKLHARVTYVPDDMLVIQVKDQQAILGTVSITVDDDNGVTVRIAPSDGAVQVVTMP